MTRRWFERTVFLVILVQQRSRQCDDDLFLRYLIISADDLYSIFLQSFTARLKEPCMVITTLRVVLLSLMCN